MLGILGIAGSDLSRKQLLEISPGCFRKPSGKVLEFILHSLYTMITNRKGSKADKAALKVSGDNS